MPVPDLTGNMTKEEIIAAYEEFGWHKRLRFDWIELNQRQGAILKTTYEFVADALPCSIGDDAQYQLTFLQLCPTGVIWTCAMCRRSEGPISNEIGRVITRERVSSIEAWEAIKKSGQYKPIGLKPISGTERLRVIS